MKSINSSYISMKLQEESQISKQTEKLLKNIGNNCKTLTRELNYQLQDSLKAQELYKRVLINQNVTNTDYQDNAAQLISSAQELLYKHLKECKSVSNRIKKSLLSSIPLSERLDCLFKRRRLKQLVIFLTELTRFENHPFLECIGIPKCSIKQYSCKVTIRIVGCEQLNRSYSSQSVITGFPKVIKKSLSNVSLFDNSDNLNAPVKCDLLINKHIVFSTIIQRPSHHCWNQTFELIHDFGNVLELHVVWISPFKSLDSHIKKTASHYRQIDFLLAGFNLLALDEEKDRGFISRVVELYPVGKVFLDTFIEPRKTKPQINRETLSKSASRSMISPSVLKAPRTSKPSLSSDFKFLALLGTGHFGKIILCQRIRTKQNYALKALRKAHIVKNDEYVQVLEEKRILQIITKSKHPFLVHLYGCFQDKKYVMFLLEFVEAGDLATLIYNMETFSVNQTRFYASIIVLCLEFLHDNKVMYRDLKLENLLIDKHGFLKLVDFGLSKTNMDKMSRTGTFCGTIDYMSPEMLVDNSYTNMVDWWALGVLTYYMVFGKAPFEAETDMESLNDIITKPIIMPIKTDKSVSSFILSLLDRNPNSRLGNRNGASDIKNHAFFKTVSFSRLLSKQIVPSFIPQLEHSLDLSYFDPQFTGKQPTLDSAESVIAKTTDQKSFFDNFCL